MGLPSAAIERLYAHLEAHLGPTTCVCTFAIPPDQEAVLAQDFAVLVESSDDFQALREALTDHVDWQQTALPDLLDAIMTAAEKVLDQWHAYRVPRLGSAPDVSLDTYAIRAVTEIPGWLEGLAQAAAIAVLPTMGEPRLVTQLAEQLQAEGQWAALGEVAVQVHLPASHTWLARVHAQLGEAMDPQQRAIGLAWAREAALQGKPAPTTRPRPRV